jgi:hypothetical protein
LRDEKGLETVNWLTLIGQEPLQQLAGAGVVCEALVGEAVIQAFVVAGGLIVQAGPEALIGDVNRGDVVSSYRQVYKVLEQVIEPVVRDTSPLLVASDLEDERAMTMRWLRRFAA